MSLLPRPSMRPALCRLIGMGRSAFAPATLALSLLLTSASRVPAADIQWSGATSSDWNDPTNWVGGVLPGAADNAHLDVSGATTDIDPFSDPGFSTTIQQLYVGDANPNATLSQSSGTLNVGGAQGWLKIGAQGGSSGIYNLSGTGVVSLTNDVFGVGEHGVGSFNLSNGAQASAPRMALGRYAEGRGSVFQTGATTVSITGSGNDGNGTPNYGLAVGEQSTALSSYTITGGTLSVSGGNLLIGMMAGSNGRMTVAGQAAVSAGHEVHVGESGTGTLVVNGGQFTAAGPVVVANAIGASGTLTQNGGAVSLSGGSNLTIGNQGSAVGSYTLAGGTLAASGRILVGEDGLGSFTQTGGANNVTMDVSVGDHVGFSTAASPDVYAMSGGTLAATAIQIGWQGYAAMNQSGGTVTTTTDVHFGGSANGNAQNGQGIYNLSGGTLVTPSIFVSSAGNSAHQFNFTGGTLRVANFNTTGTTNILGPLTQTSSANPSLLDVTTQSTTIGAGYSVSGQNATVQIDNGNTLHVQGILSIDNQAAVTMTANPGNQLLIDGSGANPNNSLNVGVAGAGQLTIGGGTFTVTTGDAVIGTNSGSSGVVTQNGGTASFHAASPNWLYIGQNAGSQGSYLLAGGSVSEPNNEEIGYGGAGTFTQSASTTNTAGNVVLGGQASGNGSYALNGGTLVARSVSGGPGTSTFKFNGGVLQASAANAAFMQGITSALVQSGGVTVNSAGNNIAIAQNLLHDSNLGGTPDGGLLKIGAGTLTLSGASSFTGGTTLSAGAIQLASTPSMSGGAIASGPIGLGTLTLAAGTTLQDDGAVRAVPNNVAITGNVAFSSAAFGSLVFDSSPLSAPSTVALANNPTLMVSSSVVINDAVAGAGQSLTKAGSGTLVLGGANSYTGPTTVTAGTLRVNGSLPAASSVAASGGTLGGSGIINGSASIASGAHLAPGGAAAIGTLTTGSISLVAGSVLDEILGTPGSGTPATGGKSTLEAVLGTLALPASGAIIVNLFDNAGVGGNGSFANGTYKLFTYASLSGGNATFHNTFSVGAAPLGKVYSFSNTGPTNGEIDLTVVTAPTAKVWNGNINGTWDTGTANWQGGLTFANNDLPTFDDSAAGTTAITAAASLSTGAMLFNNSVKNYTLGGSPLGGAGSLAKTGAGMLTLSSSNAYTGGTTVSGGVLRVANTSGSATGPGAVIINGGTLAGAGAIGGATTINSSAALGSSFGAGSSSTLTINSDLTLANNADLNFRLNQPGQAGGAGGNDYVNSTGTLSLGTGVDVDITPGASFAPGTYHLLSYGTLSNPGNFGGWNVGLAGTPASLGVRNFGFANNATNKSVDLTVATPASNLLLRYSFHDLNSAANPTVADTSGNHFTGTTLRNTNPADVATATGPDGLPAIHLTKDDNLGNINGGTATTGSGITTSTQANPALNNPSPGPTTQTFNITNGPFTATAWVKIDSLPTNNPNPAVFQVVFGTPPASSTDATGSLHMGFRNNAPYMGFWGNDTGGAALPNSFQSTWFHVAFRYNPASGGNPNLVASRQAIFINGGDGVTPGDAQLYAFKDNSAAYGQIRTLLIGRTIGSGTFVGAFGGSLADVRVYGSALDNASIALIAAPAGTLFDWNSATGADWTAAGNWFSTYAQPGPPGTGIADVVEFGTKQTIAAGNTINLNGAQQLAQLINTNANSWTLASGTAAGTNASPLVVRQISQRGAGTLTISSGLMIDDSNLLTFDGTTTGPVVISGPIYNTSAGLTKTSAGILTLAGNNTYGGPTTVSGGTLRLASPTFISSGTIVSSPVGTGTLTLAGGATLQDDGAQRTLANSVAITGNVTFSSAAGGSIIIDPSGLATPTTVMLTNNPTLTVTNSTVVKSVIASAGTLTKSGSGTLEIDGAPQFAANSALQVNGGRLRFNVTSGSPSVGSGVTATVASGAVLELAGSISVFSGSGNRASLRNNSLDSGGGLLVSHGNQQVGTIDGIGDTVVNAGASLTANHIIQDALVIGGVNGNPATVTIAASDSSGNSRTAITANPADSLFAGASQQTMPSPIDDGVAASTDSLGIPLSSNVPAAQLSGGNAAVPEPATFTLFGMAVVLMLLAARRRKPHGSSPKR